MNKQTIKEEIFTNQQLKEMIIPLFLEQLLVMLVGIADTLVISYAGEAAVSGVSLVNQFNTIFIYLFTALAMVVDWCIRAVIFWARCSRGTWKQFRVI